MLEKRNFPVEVTPFSILSWKGGEWRAEGETSREVHIVGRDDPTKFDVLMKDDLEDLVRSKKLQIREELFGFLDMSIMSPAARRRTALLMMWVSASIAARQVGLVYDFSQTSCRRIIFDKGDEVVQRFKNYLVENDFAPTKKGRKTHFASLSDKRKKQHLDIHEDRLRLHPRTLSNLMARWEADPSPATLKPNWGQQRGGGKKCDSRTWVVVKEHAPMYARENRRTYDGALQFINAEISARNSLVGEGARIPKATDYMVRKAIDEIPSFAKLFTRRGRSKMRNALRSVGQGPKFTRPGEEIIIDGWEAHVWTLLNPEVQEMFSLEVRQVRLLICPSIDHASGFIPSLSAAPTGETGALTTKSLRMVGSDRSALARAAGCISDWGPPLNLHDQDNPLQRLIHAADHARGVAIVLCKLAVLHAVRNGASRLELEHLKAAYGDTMNASVDGANPFVAEEWTKIDTSAATTNLTVTQQMRRLNRAPQKENENA